MEIQYGRLEMCDNKRNKNNFTYFSIVVWDLTASFGTCCSAKSVIIKTSLSKPTYETHIYKISY